MADTPRVIFALTEEQEMLRQTTRQFLEDRVPATFVREMAESTTGFDSSIWQSGAELGWHSLAIPEEFGGAGYTFAELSVVLEEMGRSLFPGPFLSTVVMAANAIKERARSLDERLARVEKYVTSSRYNLDREFRNL